MTDEEKSTDQLLFELLRDLKRGSCWCEMAIGNPMVREHPEKCMRAQAAYARLTVKLAAGRTESASTKNEANK